MSGEMSIADVGEQLPLRVAISTRALFAVEAEHAIFETQGVDAYVRAQRALEAVHMPAGAGLAAVERLLALNDLAGAPLVEVILVSRNAPEASLRAFASIEHHGRRSPGVASPTAVMSRRF